MRTRTQYISVSLHWIEVCLIKNWKQATSRAISDLYIFTHVHNVSAYIFICLSINIYILKWNQSYQSEIRSFQSKLTVFYIPHASPYFYTQQNLCLCVGSWNLSTGWWSAISRRIPPCRYKHRFFIYTSNLLCFVRMLPTWSEGAVKWNRMNTPMIPLPMDSTGSTWKYPKFDWWIFILRWENEVLKGNASTRSDTQKSATHNLPKLQVLFFVWLPPVPKILLWIINLKKKLQGNVIYIKI